MKGTEEELQFGDMVEVDLIKNMDDGGIRRKHLECKFVPELIPVLLEDDIIEEADVESDEEDDEDDIPSEEQCCIIEQMVIAHENLEAKVEQLEEELRSLKQKLAAVVA